MCTEISSIHASIEDHRGRRRETYTLQPRQLESAPRSYQAFHLAALTPVGVLRKHSRVHILILQVIVMALRPAYCASNFLRVLRSL